MDASVNGHLKSANVISQWVWFEGSTALTEGTAVVFNTDYGTAGDVDCRRNNHVELPGANSDKLEFAGVAARNYSASSGGQFIEVYAPGSRGVIVQLADNQTTTIGTGVITFGVVVRSRREPVPGVGSQFLVRLRQLREARFRLI